MKKAVFVTIICPKCKETFELKIEQEVNFKKTEEKNPTLIERARREM